VEKEDWVYKTSFQVTEEQLARGGAVLEFQGLDTYADIYLNGSLLKSTDNMFVGYTLSVKEVLRKGENRLQVYFHSPIKKALPQCSKQLHSRINGFGQFFNYHIKAIRKDPAECFHCPIKAARLKRGCEF
jgi:beta-galactosidase/beta-glucuronidase